MRLRATVKVRNDVLVAARERLGLNQAAFAARCGVPPSAIHNLEKLKFKSKSLFGYALKVAAFLNVSLQDVLPDEMAGMDIKSTAVAVAEVEAGRIAAAGQRFLLEAPDIVAIGEDERHQLLDLVAELPLRKAEIISARFGLGGYEPLSQVDVAGRLGITKGAVWAAEKSGIKKMKELEIRRRRPEDRRPDETLIRRKGELGVDRESAEK